MSNVKMSEPHLTGGSFLPISNMQGSSNGFTEAQMRQYGDDRAREALETAAKEAERMTMYTGGRQEAPAHETVWHAARAIRALAKEIK